MHARIRTHQLIVSRARQRIDPEWYRLIDHERTAVCMLPRIPSDTVRIIRKLADIDVERYE